MGAASAAEPAVHNIATTPSWRTSLLFLCFAAVCLAFEKLLHMGENRLRKKRQYIFPLQGLKNEILLLGALSLLLFAVQDSLLHICVPVGTLEEVGEPSGASPASDSTRQLLGHTNGLLGAYSRKLLWLARNGWPLAPGAAPKHGTSWTAAQALPAHARRLMAGASGASYCAADQEPFWSAQTIFQTHLLLFLIAVSHIFGTTVSMLLCLAKVR